MNHELYRRVYDFAEIECKGEIKSIQIAETGMLRDGLYIIYSVVVDNPKDPEWWISVGSTGGIGFSKRCCPTLSEALVMIL